MYSLTASVIIKGCPSPSPVLGHHPHLVIYNISMLSVLSQHGGYFTLTSWHGTGNCQNKNNLHTHTTHIPTPLPEHSPGQHLYIGRQLAPILPGPGDHRGGDAGHVAALEQGALPRVHCLPGRGVELGSGRLPGLHLEDGAGPGLTSTA